MADPRHSISGNTAAKPPRTQFRRPRSKDRDDFWHISQADWAALLEANAAPATRSAARKKLRLIEHVAELMETDVGITVPDFAMCELCRTAGVACRVARGATSMACAKCMKHKKPCEAGPVMQRGQQEQPPSMFSTSWRALDSSSAEIPLNDQHSDVNAGMENAGEERMLQGSPERSVTDKREAGSDTSLLGSSTHSRSNDLEEEHSARRLKRQRQREEDLANEEIEVLKLEAKAARLAMEADVFAAQSEARLMRAVYERRKSIERRR
nr:hypothetical protein B0A51_02413 [Rachicladosporium sp. CCFEE 5018]